MRLREFIAGTIFLSLFVASICSAGWILVNSGERLDYGTQVNADQQIESAFRTEDGDVLYSVNYNTIGTTCGRVGWSTANGGQWKWEVWSDGQWSDDAGAVPTPTMGAVGRASRGVDWFSVPGSGTMYGVVPFHPYSSTISLDVHEQITSMSYSEQDGWKKWRCDEQGNKGVRYVF